MTRSPLHVLQVPTELPRQVLRDAQAGDDGSLRNAVTVGRYRGEGYADDALVLAQFGDEVGVIGVGAAVEDDEPFAVMVDFSNCASRGFRHLRTYKEIWGDSPQDSGLLLLVANVGTSKKRPVVSGGFRG